VVVVSEKAGHAISNAKGRIHWKEKERESGIGKDNIWTLPFRIPGNIFFIANEGVAVLR
jgi:hypothetical protein